MMNSLKVLIIYIYPPPFNAAFPFEKRKVPSKNLCVIASHSEEWRGNPLPVGDARGRKKIFI